MFYTEIRNTSYIFEMHENKKLNLSKSNIQFQKNITNK